MCLTERPSARKQQLFFFVHQAPAVLVVQANLMLFVFNSERSAGRRCDYFQPVTHMHSGNIQIGQPLQSAEYVTKNRELGSSNV